MGRIGLVVRNFGKHKYKTIEVTGLRMDSIQANVKWSGKLHLHLLNEDQESLLSEIQWPLKDSTTYFVCASTGLLFDKETGECRQSKNVTLLLDTVVPSGGTGRRFYEKWHNKRITDAGWLNTNTAKRGPKSKEQREYAKAHESDEGGDDAEID